MWNHTYSRILALSVAATLTFSVRAQEPDNPDPGDDPSLLTSFDVKQVVPAGSANDSPYKLPGRDSYVMTPDRTGQISMTVSATHSVITPVIKVIDADGVVIKIITAGSGTIHVPSIKFNSYLHVVIFGASGTPLATRSIVTTTGGGTDGPGYTGGSGGGRLVIPSIAVTQSQDQKDGSGSGGEDSGSCGCSSVCDPTNGNDGGDVTADGLNGLNTFIQPAGISMNGDSQTQLDAHFDPTAGILHSDVQVHGNGDATVARDTSNRITSVTTSTTYTKVEGLTSPTGVKLSQWVSYSDSVSHPSNPFRTVTITNSGTNEVTREVSFKGGPAVTSVWKYTSGTSPKWEFTQADLRKKELTLESNGGDATLRVERHKLFERDAAGTSWVLVSDVRKTFKKFSFAWKKVKLEVFDGGSNPLVTTWEYWGSSDATSGRSLLKSVTYPDGKSEAHSYSATGSGSSAQYTHATQSMGSYGLMTETTSTTADGNSNTTSIEVGSNLMTETNTTWSSNIRTRETTGGASMFDETTTTTHVAFGSDFGGRPTSSIFMDGTQSQTSYTRSGTDRLTTSMFGEVDGSGDIVNGTETSTTTDQRGAVVLRTTTDIQSGVMLESSRIPSGGSDEFGRAERVDYHVDSSGNPAYWEEASYDCCGLATFQDTFGNVTAYKYDGLKRPVRVNSMKVTQHTVFDGLTVHTHRYAEDLSTTGGLFTGSASSSNEFSNSERDLSGSIHYSRSRSPQDGTLITDSTATTLYRNPEGSPANPSSLPSGIGRRVTTVLVSTTDDGSSTPSETTDYNLDGRTYQTTGNLSKNVRYSYAAGNLDWNGDSTADGVGTSTTTTVLDGSGNPKESSTKYLDRTGKTLATVSDWAGLTEYFYNTAEQLAKVKDADNVIHLYGYNAKGERFLEVLDINQDGNIDYGSDEVSFTETKATTRGSIPVIRTTKKVWKPGAGSGSGTVVSYHDVTPNGLQSWTDTLPVTGSGLGTSSSTLDLGTQEDGDWTVTSVSADGVQAREFHVDGRLVASTVWKAGATPATTAPADITAVSGTAFIAGTAYGYDTLGRLSTTTDSRTGPEGDTTTAYVSLYCDVISSVTDPGSRVTSYLYDHRGRRTEVRLPGYTTGGGSANARYVTTTNHYVDGSVSLVDGGQTYKTAYTYDYAQRMKTLTTYGDTTATTTWNYDAAGRLESKTYPDGPDAGTTPDAGPSYTYTAAGRLKKRIGARGNTTRYDYDAGRLAYTLYFDSTTSQAAVNAATTGNDPVTPDSAFARDALGRLTSASNDYSTITYGYDPDDLSLATETVSIDPDGAGTRAAVSKTFYRDPDSILRPTGYQLKNGSTVEADVEYTWGATDGRLETVGADLAGTWREFDFSYKSKSLNLPDVMTGPVHTTYWWWMADRDVLEERDYQKTGTFYAISWSGYEVNDLGQRTRTYQSIDDTFVPYVSEVALDYDSKGQVVTADRFVNSTATASGDRGYSYDGIGNRYRSSRNTTNAATATGSNLATYYSDGAGTTEGANGLNQYEKVGLYGASPAAVTYDADGNQTAGPFPNGSAGDRYWDGENRMYRNNIGSTDIYYAHDPFGRRVAKFQGGGTGMTGTVYFYDGWNVAAECSIGSSTYPLSRTYTWGPDLSGTFEGAGGVGGMLAVEIEAGTGTGVYYPTYDGNGNIMEYMNSSASVEAHFEYDPFGEAVIASGSASLFNYRFSTKPLDSETGLYYYGYRYYDPVAGRWPSRDPIDELGGENLYGMLRNAVSNKFDLLGLAGPPRNGLPPGWKPNWKKMPGNPARWKDPKGWTWRWHDPDKDAPCRRHLPHWDATKPGEPKERRDPDTGKPMDDAVDHDRNREEEKERENESPQDEFAPEPEFEITFETWLNEWVAWRNKHLFDPREFNWPSLPPGPPIPIPGGGFAPAPSRPIIIVY